MIYLDNSATTRQDPSVTAEMIRCMEEDFGNPSSLHHAGLAAEKIMKEARRKVLSAVGQKDGELIFTSGGTEADNMAIFGGAKAMKRRGDRVVTTSVEHPAVLECFKELGSSGFEVIRLGVNRQGRLCHEELEEAIDDRTVLVSMMHVNNEVGTIMPLEEAARIIREKKSPALLHCDAVQSFGKIDLPAFCDMISISGHKIHGPKGSGALWIRKGLNLPPLIFGGGQENGRRSGTENVPAIAGLGEAAKLAESLRRGSFDKVEALRKRLLEGLKNEIEDLVLNGAEEVGSGAGCASPYILNVSFPGTRAEVILHTLEQDGIYVSTGSACSSNKKDKSHVLKAMGCTDAESEGAIRFSFSFDNTDEEIDDAIDRTADAVKRFRELGTFR